MCTDRVRSGAARRIGEPVGVELDVERPVEVVRFVGGDPGRIEAGFAAVGRRFIEMTDEHVGSEVVLLRA